MEVKISNSDILTQLQALAGSLGHTPNTKEIRAASKAGVCPSYVLMLQRFGSLSAVLAAAELPDPPASEYWTKRKYSRQELLSRMRLIAKRINPVPTRYDLEEASKLWGGPSEGPYIREFGSIPEARKAAGINSGYGYSDQELIDCLQGLAKKLDRSPTTKDVNIAAKAGESPYQMTYTLRFGSHNNALKAAGLPTRPWSRAGKPSATDPSNS